MLVAVHPSSCATIIMCEKSRMRTPPMLRPCYLPSAPHCLPCRERSGEDGAQLDAVLAKHNVLLQAQSTEALDVEARLKATDHTFLDEVLIRRVEEGMWLVVAEPEAMAGVVQKGGAKAAPLDLAASQGVHRGTGHAGLGCAHHSLVGSQDRGVELVLAGAGRRAGPQRARPV